MNFKMCY